MKLLILNYEYPPIGGGAAMQTKLLAEKFAERGHKVTVITSHFKNLPWIELKENLQIIRVPAGRKRADRSTMAEMLMYLMMAKLVYLYQLIFNRPDAVLNFFLMPTGALGFLCKFLFSIPFVVLLRGADVHGFIVPEHRRKLKYFKPVSTFLAHYADKLVAVSRDLADMAEDIFNVKGVEVIENSIPICSQKRKTPSDFTRFLFVGRLSLEKSIDDIVTAFSKTENSVLEILGDGHMKESLEQHVHKLGIEDRVNFHGWVSREEVNSWMLKSHCLVLYSRVEGMSMSGLSAFSSGLPIIGSNAAGMRNFVIDKVNGFIVELDKPEVLAELMIEITEEKYNLEEMSANCRRIVEEKYSVDRAADEYLTLIKQMTGR